MLIANYGEEGGVPLPPPPRLPPRSHQILDAVFIEVSAALGEPGKQHLNETLVPAGTHGEEAVLQKQNRM